MKREKDNESVGDDKKQGINNIEQIEEIKNIIEEEQNVRPDNRAISPRHIVPNLIQNPRSRPTLDSQSSSSD